MEQVSVLNPNEKIDIDRGKLDQLYSQLGEIGAENVICRAMEELAVRLAHTDRLYRENSLKDMRKCSRSMMAIASQIGLCTLTQVAHDVTMCIDDSDEIALSATLTRLLRTGEKSLLAIWDVQDISV